MTIYVYCEQIGHTRQLLGLFLTLDEALRETDKLAEPGDVIETWETGKVDEPGVTVATRISGKWIT